ncbi:MAG: AraC family transcriptional regulator [Bacteroidota bacterium]
MPPLHTFIHDVNGKIDRSHLIQFDGKFCTKGIGLKITLTGQTQYEIGGNLYKVQPGEAFLMDRYTEFHGYVKGKTLQQGICIDISPDLIQQTQCHFDQPVSDYGEIPLMICSLRHYDLLKEVQFFDQSLYQLDWEHEGTEILYEWATKLGQLIGKLKGEQKRLDVKKMATRQEIFRRLQIALDFLHDNVKGKFSLDHLALHTGMSSYHLARNFKNCFGQTLFQYHESLKMAYAAERLQQARQMTVAELALELGYEESSYFIRRFKRHFGHTPGKIPT